jgi:UDP-glucose 4-epimerase
MRVLVTGGAGFIGSNLVDSLSSRGHDVRILDNFSTGRAEFTTHFLASPKVEIIRGDLLDQNLVNQSVIGVDAVVHLAANADVRFGWDHPRLDIEQNVVVTQNVLEAMRVCSVRRLIFSSTGSVYGEATVIPTPEYAPYPAQTSLYGASKNAAEGIISAYSEAGFIDATIFRFVSILGPRYTHGHVIDFVAQLVKDPVVLRVLGDGRQRKSYLHVQDCIRAILNRLDQSPKFETLNLGTDSYCEVRESIKWITQRMGLSPRIEYSGGNRGWVGDNPFIFLDTSAMNRHGWSPQITIQESVEDTVDWLLAHRWALDLANK